MVVTSSGQVSAWYLFDGPSCYSLSSPFLWENHTSEKLSHSKRALDSQLIQSVVTADNFRPPKMREIGDYCSLKVPLYFNQVTMKCCAILFSHFTRHPPESCLFSISPLSSHRMDPARRCAWCYDAATLGGDGESSLAQGTQRQSPKRLAYVYLEGDWGVLTVKLAPECVATARDAIRISDPLGHCLTPLDNLSAADRRWATMTEAWYNRALDLGMCGESWTTVAAARLQMGYGTTASIRVPGGYPCHFKFGMNFSPSSHFLKNVIIIC